MESDLQALVERYRNGDQDAAMELHRRFVEEMIAKVRRMLADHDNRAAFDSEGIVQEGFRSFFSALRKPSFDPTKGRIGGYLAAIVSNKVKIKLRRRYPANVDPEDLNVITDAAAAVVDGSLTEAEVGATLGEAVFDILGDSTPKECEILRSYLDRDDERSLREVARACRRSLTTVEDVVDRFTARLQEQVVSSKSRRFP